MSLRSMAALAALPLLLVACRAPAPPTTTVGGQAIDTTADTVASTSTEPPGEQTDSVGTSQWGLPLIDPIDVDPSVDVSIAGSSTVFPLSTAILTRWIDEGGPEYSIDSIGSGGGFDRFCSEAATDIANASRPIDEEEVAACEGNGRTPLEIRVGSDALSLVISPGNYFAQELTLEEVATAFSLTDPKATWADLNPDFPAHPIQLFSPGADSGTFDYFFEVVWPDLYEAGEASPILSSIAEIVGEDDNLTVTGVAEDGCTEGDLTTTCAVGYFGYAYYQENADRLRTVAVEGVQPSAESVDDGTYPISRPLFMYTAPSVIEEKPQVAEFIAYYLNNVNDAISDVGYFPAPDDALQGAADAIAEAAGW
ncbi:MAG TPA: substrate-binding domain-containing protein [Acidimicrobiia bacterium]|jgi:phosphate transport system substrate-binding protein